MLVKCGSEVLFRSGRAHGHTKTFSALVPQLRPLLLSVLTAHNQSNILVAPLHFSSGKGLEACNELFCM